MIEAVVLGSGTSNGVPALGIDYPEVFLADPRNWRTRSSLLLKGPTGNLLIDAGPELRLQLLKARVKSIEAVLITHSHADHVMGMDDLRQFCLLTRQPMPVYTLPRYQEDIKRIFAYAFREFDPGTFGPRFDLYSVPEVLDVGGMQIRTFEVRHGTIPVIGIRVGDFAYVTDVSEIPDDVVPMLEGLDTLILEGLRRAPHPNHLHLDGALEWIEKLNPRRAFLTHLAPEMDHSPTEAELPNRVRLAYDGLTLRIS